jgi:hypothetical protein
MAPRKKVTKPAIQAAAPVVAAACLHIARLCVESVSTQASKASMPQTVGVLELWREAITWMHGARPADNGLKHVSICASLAFAYPAASKATAAFYGKLISGAGLEDGSPALALRNWIMAGGLTGYSSASERLRAAHLVLDCLRADMLKKPMMKLPRVSDGAAMAWFRAQQPDRIAATAAIFPFVSTGEAQKARREAKKLADEPMRDVAPPPPATRRARESR